MLTNKFLEKMRLSPEPVSSEGTMAAIEQNCQFTETGFSNGEVKNAAGQNDGSCKIFSPGHLNSLTDEQTLHCFGYLYRKRYLATLKVMTIKTSEPL